MRTDANERAAIGAMLLDPDHADEVRDVLQADDFTSPAMRSIFRVVSTLRDGSRPVDLVTVTDELRRSGDLEAAGGPAAVADLLGACPNAAAAEHYARMVAGDALRRRVARAGAEIAKTAADPSITPEELPAQAERLLADGTSREIVRTDTDLNAIMHEVVAEAERLHRLDGVLAGISSGYDALDRMTGGWQAGDLIVLGARPSVGKTSLAIGMVSAMLAAGRRVGLVSAEMPRLAIGQRLLALRGKTDLHGIRTGLLTDADFGRLLTAAGEIRGELLVDDTASPSWAHITSTTRRWVRRRSVEIILVDYLGLIRPPPGTEGKRYEAVTALSAGLKGLARDLRVPLIVLSQLNRDAEGRVPGLQDLRESGAIEQDADLVILLHRERDPGTDDLRTETTLRLAKHRNGPTGAIRLVFDPSVATFRAV